MLQRIQTVWMLLAVLGAVFLYLSVGDLELGSWLQYIEWACMVLVLIGLFSVFSYQSRIRQLLLNRVSIIINALLIGVLVYGLLNLPGGMSFPEKGIEPIFPLIAVVCLFLANHYIRRDEKLVKSVDRLR